MQRRQKHLTPLATAGTQSDLQSQADGMAARLACSSSSRCLPLPSQKPAQGYAESSFVTHLLSMF